MLGGTTSSEHATDGRRAAITSQTRQPTSGASGSHCTSSCSCRRWTSTSARSQRALAPAAPTPAAMRRASWRAERHRSARIEHRRRGVGLAQASPSARSLSPCRAPCCQNGAGARDQLGHSVVGIRSENASAWRLPGWAEGRAELWAKGKQSFVVALIGRECARRFSLGNGLLHPHTA